MRPFRLTACITVAVLVILPAACSWSPSPKEAVCSDISTLKGSVGVLRDDVEAGNFGDARDQLDTIEKDYEALRSSASDLAASEKDNIEADLDEVKATLSSLTSATSLAEVQATLQTARSQIADLLTSITETLDC